MNQIHAGHLLTLLVVSVATACSDGEIANGPLFIDTGVILDSGRNEQFPEATSFLDVSAPYWTPTAEQASMADRAVLQRLRQMNTAASAEIADAIGDYKRQYVGYTIGGKRWILVNALCRRYWEKNESWKSAVTVVFDGGICFFRARFELATSTVSSLEVNGDA